MDELDAGKELLRACGQAGVNAEFFVNCLDSMARLYGNKCVVPESFNQIIEYLGAAERVYQALPPYQEPEGRDAAH